MTHTVYRGWYNASLGVLLADERINRMDRSCCGADGMDSIQNRKDKKITHVGCVGFRQINPIGVQYYNTPLGFVSRDQFNRMDRSEDEIDQNDVRSTEVTGCYL